MGLVGAQICAGDDVDMAIMNGLFCGHRGTNSVFLIILRGRFPGVLFVCGVSRIQGFVRVEGEVCPEIELGREVWIRMPGKQIMRVCLDRRVDDVEALEI